MVVSKRIALLVLVAALAGVGASVAWAVAGGGSAWGPGAGMGPGMMSGRVGSTGGSPVSSIAAARERAQAFADTLGLRTSEVMQFERNFYVKLVDAQGNAATEVLVDPQSGFVSLEYGPAMMWNTTYGMMTGGRATGTMMGGGIMGAVRGFGLGPMMSGATGSRIGPVAPAKPATGPVSIAAARGLAQQYLDANQPGVKVESGGDAFPGYYTFETLKNGKITGMISVNATSGAVWPHWWHGAFVTMAA